MSPGQLLGVSEDPLKQGSANLFWKGSESKYLKLRAHLPCLNYSTQRNCGATPLHPFLSLGFEPHQHLLFPPSVPPHLSAGPDSARFEDTKLLRHGCVPPGREAAWEGTVVTSCDKCLAAGDGNQRKC